jgi:hypothetical protein
MPKSRGLHALAAALDAIGGQASRPVISGPPNRAGPATYRHGGQATIHRYVESKEDNMRWFRSVLPITVVLSLSFASQAFTEEEENAEDFMRSPSIKRAQLRIST